LKVKSSPVPKSGTNLLQFILASLVFCLSTFSIGGIFASSASAETFTLSGNKSLNTNGGFRLIDGNPRLSLWDANAGDSDQQFTRLSGNRGGTLLRNQTTGKCINAHYMYNDGQINVWPCNANDIDQNWDIVDVGNAVVLRRTGTNFCIDGPDHSNAAVLHMWNCDGGNGNQRFNAYTPAPVPQNYVISTSVTDYEAWVVARRRADPLAVIAGIPSGSPDVGHAFTALIQDSYTMQKRYAPSGVLLDQTIIDRVPTVIGTFSYWPDVNTKNNNSTDMSNARDILYKGGISNKIFGVRRVRISFNFKNGMLNKSNSTKCQSTYGIHWIYTGIGTDFRESTSCTCVDQSVFLWNVITGENMGYLVTPDEIVQWINDKNSRDSGYANGGNILQ
jgi:Ricin-type beta-trefoil lectin domain